MLWRIGVVGLVLAAVVALLSEGQATAGGKPGAAGGFIKVEAKGLLKTGIMAPGGETTGTILETGSGTLELDFGKNMELREAAKKLNGKTALASGTLTVRKGVTVRLRLIVTVKSLKGVGTK
jgi:hypothetical protein